MELESLFGSHSIDVHPPSAISFSNRSLVTLVNDNISGLQCEPELNFLDEVVRFSGLSSVAVKGFIKLMWVKMAGMFSAG